MRVTTIVITAATALLGLVLSRGSAQPPIVAQPDARPAVTLAPSPQVSERSAVGTLDQVDTASQQITVATTTGKLVFRVQSGATIRQGSKTLKPSELPAHKGERVKVRYRESGGERRADWIVLAAPARPPKLRD